MCFVGYEIRKRIDVRTCVLIEERNLLENSAGRHNSQVDRCSLLSNNHVGVVSIKIGTLTSNGRDCDEQCTQAEYWRLLVLVKYFGSGFIAEAYHITCKVLLQSLFNMYVLSAIKHSLTIISGPSVCS